MTALGSRLITVVVLVGGLAVSTGLAIHGGLTPWPVNPATSFCQPQLAPGARLVASVDGCPIGSDDVDLRLAELLPVASYHGHVEAERLLSLKRAALDDLMLDQLIYREAMAAGQHASSGDVEAELQAAKARFESAELFAAALRENGFTEDAFRQRLARDVLVREARAQHARQVVTDTDVTAYYYGNRARFQRPERVHLLEILFRADPADPSSRMAAWRKARAVLVRVRRGEPFGEIARAESEDEYRVKDGDMGMVHRGRLDAEFEAAVFSATPGQFAIARSLYGCEVFEVLERQPPTPLTLEDARPIIIAGLERRRRDDGLRAWHARLLAGAHVDIRDAALRNAPAADLAALGTGGATRPYPSAATTRSSQ